MEIRPEQPDRAVADVTQEASQWGSWNFRMAVGLLSLGLIVSLVVFFAALMHPILSMHAFRQTQTALTSYWMTKGGPYLNYETPVVGWPWSIPIEFPLFQMIVAWFSRIFGIPLDPAGRTISYIFFLLSVWEVHVIARRMGGDWDLSLLLCGFLLLSPLYLFWSRTFMIESTALFFSLAFVDTSLAHLERPRIWTFVVMTVFTCLAVLVKVTTFPAFAGGVVLLMLWDAFKKWKRFNFSMFLASYAPVILAFLIGLLFIGVWVGYSDHIKEANIIGRHLTAGSLEKWNFGTIGQRLSAKLWAGIVFGRTMKDTLGSGIPFWIAFGLLLTLPIRKMLPPAILFGLYLVPFMVFTNLHLWHNYYQYANAIFLIAALAVVVWAASSFLPVWGTALIIAITVVSQLWTFRAEFVPPMMADASGSRTMVISHELRRRVPGDQMVVVLGYDWSPAIAYYSQRKAMTVPNWVSKDDVQEMETFHSFTGGMKIGAVVDCPNQLSSLPGFSSLFAKLTKGRSQEKLAGCTIYY